MTTHKIMIGTGITLIVAAIGYHFYHKYKMQHAPVIQKAGPPVNVNVKSQVVTANNAAPASRLSAQMQAERNLVRGQVSSLHQ